MTPEPEQKNKPKKLSEKDQKLLDDTKKFLAEKIKQIDMEIEGGSTSLGADVYVIFPIDED